jgi:hypothetical protein
MPRSLVHLVGLLYFRKRIWKEQNFFKSGRRILHNYYVLLSICVKDLFSMNQRLLNFPQKRTYMYSQISIEVQKDLVNEAVGRRRWHEEASVGGRKPDEEETLNPRMACDVRSKGRVVVACDVVYTAPFKKFYSLCISKFRPLWKTMFLSLNDQILPILWIMFLNLFRESRSSKVVRKTKIGDRIDTSANSPANWPAHSNAKPNLTFNSASHKSINTERISFKF